MPFKNRLLLGSLIVLIAGLLGIVFSPVIVADGVRLWIWWKARQQKLTVKIDKIEAPFLRPILLRGLRITSSSDAAFRVELSAAQATASLNLKSILLGMSGRTVQHLSVTSLRLEIHSSESGTPFPESSWITWQRLLPNSLSVDHFELRVEDGPAVILLRSGSLSFSEIESGRFSTDELTIASPLVRQTFSRLRGATHWQDNRLTLAGLSLTRGLDVESVTADLSHLSKQRLGVEFDVDAFGGKIRANISNEWRSRHSNWNMVGSGTDISLAQTSEAIGFTDRMDGLLHACKFTFRGDLRDPAHSTASLWTELTGLTWRERKADLIMLGVALYNRQIQLQQLYVKQNRNQLTLSGEGSLPSSATGWLNPDFRGDISASIPDLGDFAALFGAAPGDFAGEIAIDGTMNARDRKIGGHLAATGKSLSIFKAPIDLFNARTTLKATEFEVEQFELKRKDDVMQLQGKIDIAHDHNYSGTLNATIKDVAPYLSILRASGADSKPASAEVRASISSGVWDAHTTITLPDSSPVNLAASFPLQIGADWNTILNVPLNVTLDFPAIFLTHAPQLWRREIFADGILSGKISVSQTLQHPRITGDVQLVNGKLRNSPMGVTVVSGRLSFNEEHAALEFLNASTKDVDLSVRAEIDFAGLDKLAIKILPTNQVFDLTPGLIDCVNQLEVVPIGATLAPAVRQLEFRGGLFRADWTTSLEDTKSAQSADAITLGTAVRRFPVCFGESSTGKVLTLGANPRPQPQPVRPRKRAKHR
ncbi:MAG: hypothetical protein M3R29_07255 [Verrucomicrobiota bacterium]|nr:hypothetical protein [Verrucomicrobiota bacterium]